MKNKKGISVMIGYVLLITFAVIIGAVVFSWMKTYVPREVASCPDETSLFIKGYDYNCSSQILDVAFVNNGKFNVGGYFIYATNSTNQSLAAKDLSNYSVDRDVIQENLIRFLPISEENAFKPGENQTSKFNLSTSGFGTLYSIEIVPGRWQTEKNKRLLISCTNAKTSEVLHC